MAVQVKPAAPTGEEEAAIAWARSIAAWSAEFFARPSESRKTAACWTAAIACSPCVLWSAAIRILACPIRCIDCCCCDGRPIDMCSNNPATKCTDGAFEACYYATVALRPPPLAPPPAGIDLARMYKGSPEVAAAVNAALEALLAAVRRALSRRLMPAAGKLTDAAATVAGALGAEGLHACSPRTIEAAVRQALPGVTDPAWPWA
jgi:hypothetical protein